MVNPLRLQEINLPRVLERVNDWKIPDTEKENIRKFAQEYLSGRITGRIGKSPESNVQSVIITLKLPLEYFNKSFDNACIKPREPNKPERDTKTAKKEYESELKAYKQDLKRYEEDSKKYITEDNVKQFFDDLMTDKLVTKLYKRVGDNVRYYNGKRIGGEKKWIKGRPYALKGKKKYFDNLKRYIKFRLEDDYPEKCLRLTKILRIIFTPQKKTKDAITYKEYELISANTGELALQYYNEVNMWGGPRAAEFHSITLADITLPNIEQGENFVKIWLKDETSKTKGRLITLYGPNCYKIVKAYIEKRKAEGIQINEPLYEKSYSAMRSWLTRICKKVIGRHVHPHLLRHTAATWLVDKGILKTRIQLCVFFGWKFSSPMPDVYLDRKGITLEEVDENAKTTEMSELKLKIQRGEERINLQKVEIDNLNTEVNTMKKQMEQIFEFTELIEKYQSSYLNYCWNVKSLEDIKVAPFHLLATEGATYFDKDHVWHLKSLEPLSKHTPFAKTNYVHVNIENEKEIQKLVDWWISLTGKGGEGMVVKPKTYLTSYKGKSIQPAIKCRGKEYLRIIYGPDYTLPENLKRLRQRNVSKKRGLALSEFLLGLESLSRFVEKSSVDQNHECAFAILAFESEPVDPRL